MRVMIFDGRANKRGGDEQVIADDFFQGRKKKVCVVLEHRHRFLKNFLSKEAFTGA